ncbi:hypothetical protein F4802DRAFT_377804 [Xylaria palmicola]|nr:hypothetical protein F4802DRAFT_377804 [Xylaria palmicola]
MHMCFPCITYYTSHRPGFCFFLLILTFSFAHHYSPVYPARKTWRCASRSDQIDVLTIFAYVECAPICSGNFRLARECHAPASCGMTATWIMGLQCCGVTRHL